MQSEPIPRKLTIQNEVEQYESSSDDQNYHAPQKNQISEAIYNKYQARNQIQEVDEELPDKDSMVVRDSIKYNQANNDLSKQQPIGQKQRKIIARIKNLDTGKEQFIYDQDDEGEEQESAVSSITKGLSQIKIDPQKMKKNWIDFWEKVQKNNEQLRNYSESGMYDEVDKILKQGKSDHPVEINYKSLDDWTPLHYACYEGHEDVADLLLSHGANINAITKFKRNSLHIAVLRGYLNVTKVLYRHKIDCNAVDQDGNTALHFAAEGGYKDIIEYLLSIYCTLKKNKQGKTPIDDCCDQNLKQIFFKYGFKEKGEYEEYKEIQKSSKTYVKNKLEHQIVPRQNLKPEDFFYYKLLGKGSFGQVFLVRKKEDPTGKLYAMKVLSKDKVATKNLQRYALTQRNVMSVINHPFMAKLFFAFQNSSKLFLVMDYYPGGDLGKLISRKKNLPEQEARKYVCELVLAFEALHKNMIVFRDLKPDNVVIDFEGHCRLTDFGLSKEGIYNNTTESFCGSVAYLAPQILSKQGHSRTVDWYLLGLVLYELIVGLPPYYNSKKQVLFENIKRGPLKIPKSMSANAKDLIKKLLCRDPRKRLGANKDSEQIKQHPFFEGINWEEVFNRKLQMMPIEDPKVNTTQPIKVTFMQNQNGKKLEGWTFINKI